MNEYLNKFRKINNLCYMEFRNGIQEVLNYFLRKRNVEHHDGWICTVVINNERICGRSALYKDDNGENQGICREHYQEAISNAGDL